jgi:hypothetical protein
MAAQTPAKQLFDLLVTKNFDPECLDALGKPSPDPAETEVFSFDFTTESGNDYGTVVVMLGDENDLQVYFGDNLGRSMEGEDKTEWFNFLYTLKHLATKNLMSFSPKNLNRLRYSMQGQAAINEGLFESWTGTRTTSWNGRPTEARLMIKHKRPLGETDARFRYVESLFIETAEGERYKLPFTKLSGGRAMVEHIRQGGRVYDARGQHITEMVNELSVLSRFRRANQGKLFEGDTAQLVEQTNAYYESLQKTLKGMSKDRGYSAYFESWNPTAITEEAAVVEGLKHLFVTQSLDNRIEDALPLLAKIQQQGQAMKEANIFEAWANRLMEGTWATPDTPEKQSELVAFLSKEQPVGADATDATEQLYDLLGDDELFDQLEALAEQDPTADCRQVVYDRMQMLSSDPDVKAVIDQVQIDPEATMNPAEPTDAGMSAEPDQAQTNEAVKDPYTQTEDPEGTAQPTYPEYADSLEDILRIAGVPAEPRKAPDYESAVYEENIEDIEEFGGDASDKLMRDVMTNQQGTEVNEEEDEQLDEFAPLAAAIGSAIGRAAVGATASTIEKGLAGMAGSAIGSKIADDEDYVEESVCNMSEAGESCPVHDLEECWGTAGMAPAQGATLESALAGQYGHSGKLKSVAENADFLDRLKELSGMIRN